MTSSASAARAAAVFAAMGFSALAPTLAPSLAHACACGCGVFDIGDGTLTPNDAPSGFSAWFRYSYMDQNQNWEAGAKAPAADNGDKEIRTSFYTVGAQYMINHQWSVMAELPLYDRALTTTDDGTVFGVAGGVYTGHITDIGDLQVMAEYTGLSPDMSTGLTLGLKLPTGNDTGPNGPLGGAEFDRDSLPGTGSTDAVLGAYHVGKFTPDGKLSYLVQARYQIAFATRDAYRPGNEFDSAAVLSYDLGAFGKVSRVAPVLQLLNSYRAHDTGDNADPLNSGYERLLIAPGLEVRVNRVRFFADVALPIYQHTHAAPSAAIEGTAGQLVAPALFKIQASYSF
jgi:hypothetical protein